MLARIRRMTNPRKVAAAALLASVVPMAGTVTRGEALLLAGYVMDSEAMMDSGEVGTALGALTAGAGTIVMLTGVGTVWGVAITGAGTITMSLAA